MDVAPPSYASSSLPGYSPDARPDERTVSTNGTSVSNTPCCPAEEYQYKNGRLLLNLGPKRSGVFRPSYGWNGIVEAYVQVKKNTKNVRSIIATMEGHVTTGLTERGFLMDQTRTTVLRISQTLFDSSSGEQLPLGGARYAFSFPIPSYVAGGSHPLPPTFAALRMGLAADVTYFIRIDMIRKGKLRQNERIKAFFYYLPRTYAPPLQCEMPAGEDEKPTFEYQPNEWQKFQVLPRLAQGALSSTVPDLSVSLALPQPLVYTASSAIPFSLSVTSGAMTEAISSLFSSLSVQLIRVTTLRAGLRWTACETLLGGGEVFRVEEQGDERIMFGSVACSQAGESSWRADGVEVKYLMRVRLSPRNDVPSLACTLPTYLQDVLLTMKTHRQTLNGIEDATVPALCRMPRPLAIGP